MTLLLLYSLIVFNVLFSGAVLFFVIFYQRLQAVLLRELLREQKIKSWQIQTEKVDAVILDRVAAKRPVCDAMTWPDVPWTRDAPWQPRVTMPMR